MTQSTIIQDTVKVNYVVKDRQEIFEPVNNDDFDKLVKVQKVQELDDNRIYPKTDAGKNREYLLAVKPTLLGVNYNKAGNFLIRTNKRLFLVSIKYQNVISRYRKYRSYPVNIRAFCNYHHIVIDNLKQARYNFTDDDIKLYHTYPTLWHREK